MSLGHIQSILSEANIPELNINWQDVEDAKSDSTTPPPLESSSAQGTSLTAAFSFHVALSHRLLSPASSLSHS